MTKLSDTQAVILSAAAQRDDGAVLPLPETLKIKGGAVDKVLGSLKAKGLIDHLGTPRGDDPPPLRITRAGLEAIGVETEDDAPEGATPADTGATSADAGVAAVDAAAPATGADGAATPARSKAKAKRPSRARPRRPSKPTPRAGTKQAQMIELLKRPEGATVEQIAAATGWQHHTIRGAISGALKKKLGLTRRGHRTREVGPNKTGAKGSSHRLPDHRVEPERRVRTRDGSRHDPRTAAGRYRLHGLGSPEAEAVLAEQGVTQADLDRALAALERSEGSGSAPSSASTTTPCSGPRARAGIPICPTPARSRSSRCSGSRSTSCSAACPRAAPPGSSRTARCPTDSPTLTYAAAAARPAAISSKLVLALQHRLLAGPRLPALNDHVAVLRVELDQPRLTPGLLAGDQRRARAAERVEHDVRALARVPDRPLDQRHGLHRGMQIVARRLVDEPDVALVPRAAPVMIVAVAPAVEDRLVLALVVGRGRA